MKKIILMFYACLLSHVVLQTTATAQTGGYDFPNTKNFLQIARNNVLQGTDGQGTYFFYSEAYSQPDEEDYSTLGIRQTTLTFYHRATDSVAFAAVEIDCYPQTIKFISVNQIGKKTDSNAGNRAYKPKKYTFDASLVENICGLQK